MNAGTLIYTVCRANAGVTALISAGGSPVQIRLYPAGNIPQDDATPNAQITAATYQTVGGSPLNAMDSPSRADNERVQLDAWSLNYDEAQAISDALRTALEDTSLPSTYGVGVRVISFNGHDYDSDTKRFRVSFDVSVWTTN